MKNNGANRYVISVLVRDRVGILRSISSAVTDMGANIDGISQTVVAGYFTVTLTATFQKKHTADDIKAAILTNFDKNGVSVVVRLHEEHAAKRTVEGDGYVVTIVGRDKPGILNAVTTFLAVKGINIEDWHVEFEGGNVTHIGEITIPPRMDIKQIQDEFQSLMGGMGLTTCMQNENIFRATNEIGPIKSLLGGGAK